MRWSKVSEMMIWGVSTCIGLARISVHRQADCYCEILALLQSAFLSLFIAEGVLGLDFESLKKRTQVRGLCNAIVKLLCGGYYLTCHVCGF